MTRELDIEREIVQRGIPVSAQNTYRRALAGSRPAAVKALCLECQGWEDGARKAIRDCPSVGCPLHAVRPFQSKAGAVEDADPSLETDDSEQNEHDREHDHNHEHEPQSGVNRLRDLDAARSTVLGVLTATEWRSKSDILFLSNMPPAVWTEVINSLLSQGLVERQGERRSTVYRRTKS